MFYSDRNSASNEQNFQFEFEKKQTFSCRKKELEFGTLVMKQNMRQFWDAEEKSF